MQLVDQIYQSSEEKRYTLGVFIDILTAIWLPHGQLWAILKGAASLTRC